MHIFSWLFAVITVVAAFRESDEIKSLPGWSKSLPSRQFSGFVDANQNASLQMHYWFVESEKKDAPLVLWFNGGPGASSLYGLLIELGPFLLSDMSLQGPEYERTGIPQLQYNQYGWQKKANILALSMPPPVGFSFCTPPGPSAEGNDCGAWNDTSTADATYYAIQSWLQRYPEYRKTDMFIMGESYAGVYVPMIVKNILAGNDDGHSTDESHIRLKGFGVGDACTPPDICGSKTSGPFFQIQFLYGKSAFSNKLYEEINSVCSTEELKNGYLSDECAASVDKIDAEVGGYWAYGFYDACWYENDIRRALAVEGEGEGEGKSYRSYRKIIDVTKYQRKTETEGASVGEREYYGPPIATSSSRNRNTRRPMVSKTESVDVTQIGNDVGNDVGNDLGNDVASVGFIGGNGYACGGPTAQVEWLSRPEVMQALNIPSDGNFFQCDNGEDFTYTLSEMDLISWYKEIIAQNKLRILVYNGDTDPCINSYQAQNWTRNLGFEEVQSWRPWTLDGCQSMAGYITRYENNFDFLTIRGSGHMVPQDRPQVALSFLTKFLEGVDYPHYDTSCTGGVKN